MKTKGAVALCRCFASTKFPLCDGSHNKHNADNGDNAGPIVLKNLGGGSAPVEVPKVDDSGLKVPLLLSTFGYFFCYAQWTLGKISVMVLLCHSSE